MTGKEEALESVRREFAVAEEARHAGNQGMLRVCARRAAGAAVAWWYATRSAPPTKPDAMTQLKALSTDGAVPAEIRDAASRLTAKVTADFTAPGKADLLADSRMIVEYVVGGKV